MFFTYKTTKPTGFKILLTYPDLPDGKALGSFLHKNCFLCIKWPNLLVSKFCSPTQIYRMGRLSRQCFGKFFTWKLFLCIKRPNLLMAKICSHPDLPDGKKQIYCLAYSVAITLDLKIIWSYILLTRNQSKSTKYWSISMKFGSKIMMLYFI